MDRRPLLQRVAKSSRNRARTLTMKARGAVARVLNAPVWTCGPGLLMGASVRLEIYGELRLGRRVELADGCNLAVGPGGVLEIGDDVFIGRGTVVVARKRISIGTRVLIAEHCSVRDADHNLDAAGRAAEISGQATGIAPARPGESTEVRIEDDVWIGAGVRVLRGTTLARGCVVAANAVVRGSFDPSILVGGVPARALRSIASNDGGS